MDRGKPRCWRLPHLRLAHERASGVLGRQSLRAAGPRESSSDADISQPWYRDEIYLYRCRIGLHLRTFSRQECCLLGGQQFWSARNRLRGLQHAVDPGRPPDHREPDLPEGGCARRRNDGHEHHRGGEPRVRPARGPPGGVLGGQPRRPAGHGGQDHDGRALYADYGGKPPRGGHRVRSCAHRNCRRWFSHVCHWVGRAVGLLGPQLSWPAWTGQLSEYRRDSDEHGRTTAPCYLRCCRKRQLLRAPAHLRASGPIDLQDHVPARARVVVVGHCRDRRRRR
mmetsp:Transcript_3303/g.9422  ORF Transcript_3303/g.9422 Transcript_3303/m.9422 type:complete len:281 (+) Transcript_3303:1011-1853(+)